MAVTIVTMFVGFFMGMIFISATTSALQSQDAKSAIGQQKLEKIFNYLMYKQVPAALCGKILEYFEYSLTSSVSLSQMSEFKELPANIHTQARVPDGVLGARVPRALPGTPNLRAF